MLKHTYLSGMFNGLKMSNVYDDSYIIKTLICMEKECFASNKIIPSSAKIK